MKEDAIICSKNQRQTKLDQESMSQSSFTELEEIYSPLLSMGESSSSPIRTNPLPSYRMKVEGPLTPPSVILPPTTKAVTLKDIIDDIPAPIEDPEDHISEAELAAFFEVTIKPIADRANRALEQEQLQEADATKRVDVPVMDFSLPIPPWKTYLKTKFGQYRNFRDDLSKQMRLIEELAEIQFKNSYWIGAKRIERELRWSPFPLEMGRIITLENIDGDDREIDRFMVGSGPKDEFDSGSLIWKPEGLRILKSLKEEEEEDDDLGPGMFREGKDMRSLVTKRKLQFDEAEGPHMDEKKRKDGAGLVGRVVQPRRGNRGL